MRILCRVCLTLTWPLLGLSWPWLNQEEPGCNFGRSTPVCPGPFRACCDLEPRFAPWDFSYAPLRIKKNYLVTNKPWVMSWLNAEPRPDQNAFQEDFATSPSPLGYCRNQDEPYTPWPPAPEPQRNPLGDEVVRRTVNFYQDESDLGWAVAVNLPTQTYPCNAANFTYFPNAWVFFRTWLGTINAYMYIAHACTTVPSCRSLPAAFNVSTRPDQLPELRSEDYNELNDASFHLLQYLVSPPVAPRTFFPEGQRIIFEDWQPESVDNWFLYCGRSMQAEDMADVYLSPAFFDFVPSNFLIFYRYGTVPPPSDPEDWPEFVRAGCPTSGGIMYGTRLRLRIPAGARAPLKRLPRPFSTNQPGGWWALAADSALLTRDTQALPTIDLIRSWPPNGALDSSLVTSNWNIVLMNLDNHNPYAPMTFCWSVDHPSDCVPVVVTSTCQVVDARQHAVQYMRLNSHGTYSFDDPMDFADASCCLCTIL